MQLPQTFFTTLPLLLAFLVCLEWKPLKLATASSGHATPLPNGLLLDCFYPHFLGSLSTLASPHGVTESHPGQLAKVGEGAWNSILIVLWK